MIEPSPRTLPAIALQSIPSCCWICKGEEWVLLVPLVPGVTAAPIRCPHCSNTADLLEVLGEVAR